MRNRRRKTSAKIGAIFVISVMALSGTGAAYALWWDDLHLDITISTGTIGAEWSFEGAYDSEIEGKDVSSVTAQLKAWPEGADGVANRWLFIHISNAYPCINYTVDFDIHNTGTIPIHIAGPFVWDPLIINMLTGDDGWGTIKFYDESGNEFLWEDIQIHPGIENAFHGSIVIHFNNNLPQNIDQWIYCKELVYHQYNEPYS